MCLRLLLRNSAPPRERSKAPSPEERESPVVQTPLELGHFEAAPSRAKRANSVIYFQPRSLPPRFPKDWFRCVCVCVVVQAEDAMAAKLDFLSSLVYFFEDRKTCNDSRPRPSFVKKTIVSGDETEGRKTRCSRLEEMFVQRCRWINTRGCNTAWF